jgi:hypothetical protein
MAARGSIQQAARGFQNQVKTGNYSVNDNHGPFQLLEYFQKFSIMEIMRHPARVLPRAGTLDVD